MSFADLYWIFIPNIMVACLLKTSEVKKAMNVSQDRVAGDAAGLPQLFNLLFSSCILATDGGYWDFPCHCLPETRHHRHLHAITSLKSVTSDK